MDRLVWCSQNQCIIHNGNCLFFFFRAPWIKLFSLISLAVVSFDERYWPLPAVLVETLSFLARDTAVSWSCLSLPPLWPISFYASHYPLATLQVLSSPHTIISSLASPAVPMSSIKTTDWSHWHTFISLVWALHQILRAYTQCLLSWDVNPILTDLKTFQLNTS